MGRMFENRKSTMFARWDRMAKQFTRISKDIHIAVKAGGGDPDHNPQLRRVLRNAKAVNMPKEKVENSINKALGVGGDDYEELVYEGYAPHGIALVVETATDNPTRTIANLRMHFKKLGGNIGTTGSVAFMFDRMGVFRIRPEDIEDRDDFELEMIDHGLEDMGDGTTDAGDPVVIVRCAFNDFGTMQTALEERGIEPVSSESEYVPQNLTELPDEQAEEVLKLVDKLEQDDDVQKVFHTLA